MRVLFILFVLVPIIEMWLLIKVGGVIGALPTIALVLLTAMIGLAMLRQQGFSTLARANRKMNDGQIPAQEMVDGLFLAVGGALLLTPGFFTDAFGFACLIPGLRQLLLGQLIKRVQVIQMQQYQGFSGQPPRRDHHQGSSNTIDGEYRRED
ncbi:membrane protein FxsA [Aurantivibrio plasticivorans]